AHCGRGSRVVDHPLALRPTLDPSLPASFLECGPPRTPVPVLSAFRSGTRAHVVGTFARVTNPYRYRHSDAVVGTDQRPAALPFRSTRDSPVDGESLSPGIHDSVAGVVDHRRLALRRK